MSESRQRPSVGRIVHYRSHGTPIREDGSQAHPPRCRAAIIADVYDETNPHPDPEVLAAVEGSEWVSLTVLNPRGTFYDDACHDEGTKLGGTWHWPEMV
ncbi:hypothetical protein [Streptomyces sp. NPDC056291]|uniref:hypothetical protein n=1 Tax=Streptomyces sp. NPDC056291 TaxID=3345772 RepID=UPI0035DAD753